MNPPVSGSMSFQLECAMQSLDSVHGLVHEVAEAFSLPQPFSVRLRLIVEELFTNVIMHGEVTPGSEIKLKFVQEAGDGLRLHWADPGIAFDPRRELPDDGRGAELADRPIGGLGWPLILAYAEIEHYAHENNHNRLILRIKDQAEDG